MFLKNSSKSQDMLGITIVWIHFTDIHKIAFCTPIGLCNFIQCKQMCIPLVFDWWVALSGHNSNTLQGSSWKPKEMDLVTLSEHGGSMICLTAGNYQGPLKSSHDNIQKSVTIMVFNNYSQIYARPYIIQSNNRTVTTLSLTITTSYCILSFQRGYVWW